MLSALPCADATPNRTRTHPIRIARLGNVTRGTDITNRSSEPRAARDDPHIMPLNSCTFFDAISGLGQLLYHR